MKIAFDLEVLNERGTTVSTCQYARYGKQYGGAEPLILYRTTEGARAEAALDRISKIFKTIKYDSENDLVATLKQRGFNSETHKS